MKINEMHFMFSVTCQQVSLRKLSVEEGTHPSDSALQLRDNVCDFRAEIRQRKETQNFQITGMQSYYFN